MPLTELHVGMQLRKLIVGVLLKRGAFQSGKSLPRTLCKQTRLELAEALSR
jgi:hypothetical protein